MFAPKGLTGLAHKLEGREAFPPKPRAKSRQPRAIYRFDCPRTIFFTFCFFDPRAYSRGFCGLSVLRFFRAVRFAFLRSSLLSAVVFAMNSYFVI
jgi:hypothetical protein